MLMQRIPLAQIRMNDNKVDLRYSYIDESEVN